MPENETSQFTEQYYKSRRQLMVFSGVLLSWELIGLELSKDIEVATVNFSLKSPQAAPFVVMVLMVYFFLRTSIEWLRTPRELRLELASKLDVILTLSITSLALIVFAYQTVSGIQIANIVRVAPLVAMLGAGIGLGSYKLVRNSLEGISPLDNLYTTVGIPIGFVLFVEVLELFFGPAMFLFEFGVDSNVTASIERVVLYGCFLLSFIFVKFIGLTLANKVKLATRQKVMTEDLAEVERKISENMSQD